MQLTLLALCLSASLCMAGTEVKRIDAPVTVDGQLDEAVWEHSTEFTLEKSSSGKITNPTVVRLAYDAQYLYVAFVCHETNMKGIANRWTHAEERDNSIWTDDCVEVFLDPWGTRKQHYHIIVNSSGVVYDAFLRNTSWDAHLKVGISKQPDRWIVEMAIPFDDLCVSPQGGEVWLGNFCREEKPCKENTSLFPVARGFNDPASFGSIALEPAEGDVSFRLTQIGVNRVSANLCNRSSQDRPLRILLKDAENGSVILQKDVIAPAGQVENAALSYSISAGTKTIEIQVADPADNRTIYANRIPLTNKDANVASLRRVWHVDQPLYEELLSGEPARLAGAGTLFWTHGMDHQQMRRFALQYSLRYVYDEYYALMADNKLLPFTNPFMLETPVYQATEKYKQYGVKSVLFANYRDASEFKIGRNPFLCDPAVAEVFLKSTEKCLQERGEVIWAVSPGDEVYEGDEQVGVELFATVKDKYEFIRQADSQVKAQYGGGVYGIPTSLKDNNPYRWIAYRRWLNDRYAAIYTDFYKRAKGIKPDVKVVSMDPIAFHHPYDFSRAAEYCDVVVHQLYPRRDGNRADFGFLTKLLVDLSGLEVWPCPHVEEYAGSFTPEEVVELISQVFRNGGTGLDYYLDDTVGRRAKTKYMHMEYWGAPDRWQIEMALAAEGRKMNKLKFPEPDCAILYSCDSYASQMPGTPSDEVEVAYTLLGPNAGSWFTFIDDNQIERDTVRLADFKVVYVPLASYQRRSVVAKLVDYVRGGGTLVCGDPSGFSRDVHGKEMADLRTQLFGANADSDNAKSPGAGVTPPAVISLGKGKVYRFAVNPFAKKAFGSEEHKKFFKQFQQRLGLQTDCTIWRFQFPMDLIKPTPVPAGQCLTGNHIHWQSFQPLSVNNVDVPGIYGYSLSPDMVADQGDKAVSFAEGKLTNRRKAPAAGNVDCGQGKLNDWIVKYKKIDPFDIEFDFGSAYLADRVRIFYSHSGTRPEISVEGSADGKTWVAMGSAPEASESPDDVRDVEIALSGDPVRYLRVKFGKRSEGAVLTIAEVEIWSK